ncbi:MAG: WG repeat-containing protein [Bacteroidales bacterium]|nr:WG repeat-containing protein [Bacteroidales bacterium]
MNRILLIFVLFLSACVHNTPAPAPELEATVEYDDSLYCFNGLWRVTSDGQAGLVDGSGRVVLATEYDSIEFISDDIALIGKGADWWLSTRKGRIFASGSDAETLADIAMEEYDRMLLEDVDYWDSILDLLDALCNSCLKSGGRKLSGRADLIGKYEELKSRLASSRGMMNEAQLGRLWEIEAKFNRYRR